jgi:hypothetical protein
MIDLLIEFWCWLCWRHQWRGAQCSRCGKINWREYERRQLELNRQFWLAALAAVAVVLGETKLRFQNNKADEVTNK